MPVKEQARIILRCHPHLHQATFLGASRGSPGAAILSRCHRRRGRTAAGNGSMACNGHSRHSQLYRDGKTTNNFADSNNKKCRASNDRERRRVQAIRRAPDPCRRGRRGLPHLKLEGEAKPQGRRRPRLPAHASMSSSPAHLLDPRLQISLDQVRQQVPDKTPFIDMCATGRGLAAALP